MDTSELAILILGLAAIGFVLWYFFAPQKATRATAALEQGPQTIRVVVKGGYSPGVISAKAGRPLRLEFYRDETSSCSEQVVFGDFGISRELPPFQTTSIEFTPEKPGEYTFTCGMSMMRGKLIVEPA